MTHKHMSSVAAANEGAPSARKSLPFRKTSLSLMLEPRILLDAAGVATAVAESQSDILSTVSPDATSDALLSALSSLQQPTELVIIDSAVTGAGALASSAQAEGKAVLLLDSGSDGIQQIVAGIASYSNLSAIHVISHAADGRLSLGGSELDQQDIAERSAELGLIGQALSANGDILLYGCDLASDLAGQAFIQQLSAATGADVAASTDITGSSGDLDLEYQAGAVETSTLDVMRNYLGDLNLDGVKAGSTETGGTSQELGSYVDADGPWVVSGGGSTNPSVTVWFVNGATRTPYVINRPDTTNWSTAFGQGVAIDSTTNTLVIADPLAGTYGRLGIYQFNTGTNQWVLKNNIDVTASGADIGPWTGGYGKDYIALSGKHLIVGNPQEGTNSGRVHWYADSSAGGDWTSYASGTIDEPEVLNTDSPERFGAAVAIAKDYFIVGAPTADTTGNDSGGWWSSDPNYNQRGRVYIYSWTDGVVTAPVRYTNGTWSYLSGQDDMNGLNGGAGLEDQFFGGSLAMEYYDADGTGPGVGKYTIVAGAPGDGANDGKIYIYQTTDGTIGTLQSALGIYGQTTAGDPDRYGAAVDVSQGRILVGAYAHTLTTDTAVWFYEAPSNNWTLLAGDTNNPAGLGILQKTFTAAALGHGSGTDYMGASVAMSLGNVAVIGSPRYSTGAAGQPGGVDFVFMRTPVAVDDAVSIGEDAYTTTDLSIDILKLASPAGTAGKDILGTEVLAGTVGVNNYTLTVLGVSGSGTAVWNGTNLLYRQGELSAGISNYNYLGAGQTAVVTITYKLTGDDFNSTGKVYVTLTGANDNPVFVAGSIPNLSDNRRIDADGNGTYEFNGGTVGDYTAGPTPSYQLLFGSFTDPDQNAVLTYSLDAGTTSAAIASMISVSSSGLITWNLTTGVAINTTYNVGIKATDNSAGTAVGVIQFTVQRDDVRPEKSGSQLATVNWTEDTPTIQALSGWFTDDDFSNGNAADEALSYSITYSGPGSGSGWLSIRSDTGQLQGTPVNDNVGTTAVTVTVTDKYGQQISHSFNLVVANVNDAPITQVDIDPVLADQGVAFSFQLPGFNTSATRDDDLFRDVDNPANGTTYTAELVTSTGTLIRTLSAAPGGSGNGSWLTFTGGSIAGSGVVTGSGTFGGTSTDAIGTLLYVRVRATDDGAPAANSTYTFTVQTFAPTLTTTALASGAANAELGTAISLSRDGLYMAVGAPNALEKGGVTIYNWNGTAWAAMTFTVPAGVVAGDRFGQSLALDYNGDRLLVGAPGANGGKGIVYAFTRATTVWSAAAVASYSEVAGNSVAGDNFGASLAIYTDVNNANDGQSFIVGAPFDSDGGLLASGKVFLHGWGTAAAIATITPTTDVGDTTTTYDLFGYSLAYDGNVAVIGSPYDTVSGTFMAGSATVIGIDNGGTVTPSLAAGVRSKLSLGTSAVVGDMFGMSVDIDLFDGLGNAASKLDSALVAVGAPGRDDLADDHGAVYLYRSDALVASGNRATTISGATVANGRLTQFTAYDGRSFQYYGWSVALGVQTDTEVNSPNASASTRLLVGSQQTADRTGSVYLYKYTTGWNGQRYIPTGTGSNSGSMYGRALDISSIASPRWATGAPYSGASSYEGRVYAATATASASALSLDPGAGTLEPMATTTDTSLVSMEIAPATEPSADTSLVSMEMAPAPTTDAGLTGTTGSTGSSTTTETAPESFTDLLLMDMLTTDPLATGTADCATADACIAMNNSVVPVWAANGLTRQVGLLQARRDVGVQSLLDRLDSLVS